MPFVLAIHTAFNLGGAFIAARLNDSFRDIQQIIPFLFNLLRYMSGVMFPISRFLEADTSEHAALRPLIEHNPMRLILAMYRWVFLGDPMAMTDVVRIMVVSAVMLVARILVLSGGRVAVREELMTDLSRSGSATST